MKSTEFYRLYVVCFQSSAARPQGTARIWCRLEIGFRSSAISRFVFAAVMRLKCAIKTNFARERIVGIREKILCSAAMVRCGFCALRGREVPSSDPPSRLSSRPGPPRRASGGTCFRCEESRSLDCVSRSLREPHFARDDTPQKHRPHARLKVCSTQGHLIPISILTYANRNAPLTRARRNFAHDICHRPALTIATTGRSAGDG